MWLAKEFQKVVRRVAGGARVPANTVSSNQQQGAGETAGAQAETQQSDATARDVPAEGAPSAGKEIAMAAEVTSDLTKAKGVLENALNHLHKALQWAGSTLIPAIEKAAPDVEAITELVDPKLETLEGLAFGALGAVASQLEKLDSADSAVGAAAKQNLLNIGYDETAIAEAKASYATIKGDITTLKSKL